MQHIVPGRGSLTRENLAALMQQLSICRPMLVCSREMAELFEKRVGMPMLTFSAFHPNPVLSDCEAGASRFNALGCDGLISFGGGSSMDCAKGAQPLENKDYGKIINEKHYRRLLGLIDPQKVVCGGGHDLRFLRCD